MQRRRGEGVRPDSRVGLLLAEFNSQEDWVAQVILKHKLASILQANVKGWLVRKKWAVNREELVDSLHRHIEKERANKARRAKLKEQLAERRAKGGEALAFLTKAIKKPSMLRNPLMGAGSKWGMLQAAHNADLAASGRKTEQPKPSRGKESKEPEPSTSESSEFSDLEMDDIAKVKLRAVTPPWQRTEESLWLGQYNKLGKKSTRAAIEATWDLEQSRARLEMARERRMARNHDGEDAVKGADGEDDPANQKLSNDRVRELLYPAYLRKFARMGLLEYNPLDLPHSLAGQDLEEEEEEEEEVEESDSDIEVEESKQLNTVDSQQRSSKGGKNGPLGQPSSQDKSPEALAAELGIPVASKSVKRGSLQRGSAAKAKETKQEMAAQMEAMME
uniref:Uncharacterized protein n=2 Tax=Dunaliella tertiolecta TaxID=3047 RepID=A0A6S8MFQ1_DUNTE